MEKLNSKKFEKYTVQGQEMNRIVAGASGGTMYATCIDSSTGSSTHDYRADERGDCKILPAANNISSR